MFREVLLGDEAVALGAVHAGLGAAYSYPGTPASEIMEHLLRLARSGQRRFAASWSINEKVAFEEALGVSFAGRRALVSFKHVGLNVAADPFMNSAMTGARGGLVVVSADDPGMHSSQNEQDSRYYAEFAGIFAFEPADHQEAYDMTREAFDLSERLGLPVLIRMVTRLAHSRAPVETRAPADPAPRGRGDRHDWTLLPANARRRHEILIRQQPELTRLSNESRFNVSRLNGSPGGLGIIAAGIAANYFLEAAAGMADPPPFLKISTYPVPEGLIRRLVGAVETVLVLEDGYPFVERQLRGIFGVTGKTIRGKLDGTVPRAGELTPDTVRAALGLAPPTGSPEPGIPLPGRPPQLCAGCPHADTLKALNAALADRAEAAVFSDIGCYTLGALPPYNAVHTCVCMGASIGMARGAADVGVRPSIAVIGDSTFAHSGITPLLGAVAAGADMTVIILDNETTAMTGGQPSLGSGQRLLSLLAGLGIPAERLRTITPLPRNHAANVAVLREELDRPGVSVVVAARACVQEAGKARRAA